MTASMLFNDEVGLAQETQMFRNGRPRNRKGISNLAGWLRSLAK